MKLIKFLVCISAVLTLSSSVVFAQNGPVSDMEPREVLAGGFSDGININTRVYTRIRLESNHANPSGCANSNIIVIRGPILQDSNETVPANRLSQSIVYDQQYSLALTAVANGNSLGAFLAGCVGGENGDLYAIALRLTLEK